MNSGNTNHMFEYAERDAWLDLFAAAPEDCVQNLGISSSRIGEAGVLACRDIPSVVFNRAMCVGAVAPTAAAELDEASAWLETNAAPGWGVQVTPSAHTGAVLDWLYRHIMAASGTGWAIFKRGVSPAADAQGSEILNRR